MGLKRTVEPVVTPVSLGEAKAHCRITHSDEDALITDLIGAAVSMVEDYCGRSIMAQTWQLTLDGFAERIILPRGPVSAISGFTYLDADGASTTVPATIYAEDLDADPQAIVREPRQSWPSPGDYVNPVTITYTAGYSTVPAAIKQAILMLVASWYQNRSTLLSGSSVAEMPLGTMALLQNHRAFA